MSNFNWEESTVINKDNLDNYFYEVGSDSDRNIQISSYCIQVQPSGFSFESLAEFIGDSFSHYVFSENKVEKLQSEGRSPHRKAQQKANISKQFRQDGTLGEYILFLFMDGFFDTPMISHKVSNKQSYKHEVYGCDNLFFGEFKGDECIGIGEAKVYKNCTDGLREAVKSISEFHNVESMRYLDQELSIAPSNISENLNKEQFNYLADAVVKDPAEYPILHPVFICHDISELGGVESVEKEREQIQSEIKECVENMEYIRRTNDQVEKGTERLRRAHLLFLFLPVPDLDEFRERMLVSIDPALKYVIEAEKEAGSEEDNNSSKEQA